eukprot:scaffold62073_cov60-Attheya_sp.AAC.1
MGCLVEDAVGTLLGVTLGLPGVGFLVGEYDNNVPAHASHCLAGWFWGNISGSRNGIGNWEQGPSCCSSLAIGSWCFSCQTRCAILIDRYGFAMLVHAVVVPH